MGPLMGEETGPIPLDLRFKMILLDYLVVIDNMNMKKSIIKMSTIAPFPFSHELPNLSSTSRSHAISLASSGIFYVAIAGTIDYRRHCQPLDFTAPSTDPPSS